MKIQTEKQFNSALANIKINGKALDAAIQDAGLFAIKLIADHQNTNALNRLTLALPKGNRKVAFDAWVLAHAEVTPNKGLKAKEQPWLYERGETLLAEAEAKAWYTFKANKPEVEFYDVQAAIDAVIAKVTKAGEKGIKLKNADKLQALVSLAAKGEV